MMRVATDILVARLLWPAPRIRWEAARAIALLVRRGDTDVKYSLLDWIARRSLESEVVLGLSVIDAFKLGSHFRFEDVYMAIRSPSLLADWLLARNFDDADCLYSERHAFAPDVEIKVEPSIAAAFSRYKRSAVPPIFEITLKKLEVATGVPLLQRWEHEWRWLQTVNDRPIGEYPKYFYSGSARDQIGPFDGAQREIYATAFLRTLHWAVRECGASRQAMELQALTALTMNRGLADITPVKRPSWAQLTISADSQPSADAREIWFSAAKRVRAGEVIIALNVNDVTESGFVDYRFRLAAVPKGWVLDETEPAELRAIHLKDELGSLFGVAGRQANLTDFCIDEPTKVAQNVGPYGMGRVHIETITELSILSPYLTRVPTLVEARTKEMVGRSGSQILSRWRYWYSGWAPAKPIGMVTTAPSLTTASKAAIADIAVRHNVSFAAWVEIHRGSKEQSYSEYVVTESSFWLDDMG